MYMFHEREDKSHWHWLPWLFLQQHHEADACGSDWHFLTTAGSNFYCGLVQSLVHGCQIMYSNDCDDPLTFDSRATGSSKYFLLSEYLDNKMQRNLLCISLFCRWLAAFAPTFNLTALEPDRCSISGADDEINICKVRKKKKKKEKRKESLKHLSKLKSAEYEINS